MIDVLSSRAICHECGALLAGLGEFHPYVFCLISKAGRDPWSDAMRLAIATGAYLPPAPPSLRDLAADMELRQALGTIVRELARRAEVSQSVPE